MAEHYPDSPETIERLLLWDDIKDIFQANAHIVGIQPPLGTNHYRLPLVAKPGKDYILQLWGKWEDGRGLCQASLIYQDKQASERGKWAECFNYSIIGTTITHYASAPKDLSREDIEDLRADLSEAEWDPAASAYYAAHIIYRED